MPPRYGKTEIAVKGFIEWVLLQYPTAKFIHLSYSADLALDNSSEIREDMKSEWYQQYWKLETKPDADSKSKWYTKEGGGMYSTGTMGAITGFGAGELNAAGNKGAIIIDDPIKPEDADSKVQREKANERLNNTILSRRNDRNTPIIIIMQRLHEDDMSGFAMRDGTSEKFVQLSLPAIMENGRALWPLKHTIVELMNMKNKIRRVFTNQYMQQPAPDEGNIFKKQWWKWYYKAPETFHEQVQSWDFAVKDKTTSDFAVGLVAGRNGADKYLLDCVRDKMNFAKSCEALIAMSKKWPRAYKKLVEDKANGSPVLSTLQKTVPGMIPVQPINDKVFRAYAVQPEVMAGNWWLPHPTIAPWIMDFVDELAVFNQGRYDDQVDAFSMLAKCLMEAPIAYSPITGHSHG